MTMPDMPADGHRWAISRRAIAFAARDGKITAIYDMVNPDKLTHLSR